MTWPVTAALSCPFLGKPVESDSTSLPLSTFQPSLAPRIHPATSWPIRLDSLANLHTARCATESRIPIYSPSANPLWTVPPNTATRPGTLAPRDFQESARTVRVYADHWQRMQEKRKREQEERRTEIEQWNMEAELEALVNMSPEDEAISTNM